MSRANENENISERKAPLDISSEQFREVGHRLVDQIADFLESIPSRPVTRGKTPTEIQELIGQRPLPESGTDARELLDKVSKTLFNNSLLNGHPKFFGYITSSAAPIGALADMLAASINPNCGAWTLAPVATEIEKQTIRWISELIGYHSDCGGILVSGGNVANFVGFLVARYAKADWDIRQSGLRGEKGKTEKSKTLRIYCSAETHTWVNSAADMYGIGVENIRWIPIDSDLRMQTSALREQIKKDREEGDHPFIVVGTAGSVSTGAIDPLAEIAAICKEYDLWFHVDGAYGAFAAAVDGAPDDLSAMREADSIALDPHKWLYAPLEVGCALVRNYDLMRETFSYHPAYYKFDEFEGETPLNFVDHGPQNSRGFRALKVWLALAQVGRSGYQKMIAKDIALAKRLFVLAQNNPNLEAFTNSLSITTFRYKPADLNDTNDTNNTNDKVEEYLNELNTELITRLQQGGEAFVSNAVIDGKYVLRACVVNFRTTEADIDSLPEIITRLGAQVDRDLRP